MLLRAGLPRRLIYRGQVLALAVVIILLFILVAAVLIDVYHLEEARNWGYRVAQQAAMAGVSLGRDWEAFQTIADPPLPPVELATVDPLADPPVPECVDPGLIRLNGTEAYDRAEQMLIDEMNTRGFVFGTYNYDIRVITEPGGDTIAGFPPVGVRLMGNNPAPGTWTTTNPAVGVSLSFRVYTFFMSLVGTDSMVINVFAAAEAAQPPMCPGP